MDPQLRTPLVLFGLGLASGVVSFLACCLPGGFWIWPGPVFGIAIAIGLGFDESLRTTALPIVGTISYVVAVQTYRVVSNLLEGLSRSGHELGRETVMWIALPVAGLAGSLLFASGLAAFDRPSRQRFGMLAGFVAVGTLASFAFGIGVPYFSLLIGLITWQSLTALTLAPVRGGKQ